VTYFCVYLVGFVVAFVWMSGTGPAKDIGKGTDFINSLVSALLWPLTFTYAFSAVIAQHYGWRK
jgi:hypothetical protein